MLKFLNSREFKVGLFTVVGFFIFYFGYNYLSGTEFFNQRKSYYVIIDDVKDLPEAAKVNLSGNPIGEVAKAEIFLEGDSTYKWLITISINKSIIVKKGTIAVLTSGGVLSGPAINLLIPKKETRISEEGDTLIYKTEKGIMDELKEAKDKLAPKMDTVLSNINHLTDKEVQQSMKAVFKNLEHTTSSLNQTIDAVYPALNQTMGNLNALTASLVKTEQQLKPILAKMNNVADSIQKSQLAATIAQTRKTIEELNGITKQINSGEGSIGKLVKTDSLHNNLNQTLKDLDKLFIDMQEHPKRYIHFSVFGKKDK